MKRAVLLVLVFSLVLIRAAAAGETQKQREQKEADLKWTELRLAEADRKVGSLGARINKVPEESRSEVKRLMEELGKKRELASRKMGELASADSANWDRVKAQANSAIDDVNNLYDRIVPLLKQ